MHILDILTAGPQVVATVPEPGWLHNVYPRHGKRHLTLCENSQSRSSGGGRGGCGCREGWGGLQKKINGSEERTNEVLKVSVLRLAFDDIVYTSLPSPQK